MSDTIRKKTLRAHLARHGLLVSQNADKHDPDTVQAAFDFATLIDAMTSDWRAVGVEE